MTYQEWLQEFQSAFDQARLDYQPSVDKNGKERTPQNVGLIAVKKIFRKATFKEHPDYEGTNEGFNALKEAYDFMVKKLTNQGTQFSGEAWKRESDGFNFWEDHMMRYKEIILELQKLDGLVLELVGTWLWVSGQTKKHKDKLKDLGLLYAAGKKMWYHSPSGKKRKRRGTGMSMDDIKSVYGSQTINNDREEDKPSKKVLTN